MQQSRKSRLGRVQTVAAEVVHAGPHGVCAGEHHSVCGKCDGNRSVGVRKANPGRGQGIQVWRFNGLVAVTAEVVGADGIDGDQEDVRRIIWCRCCGGRKGEDEKRGKERECHPPETPLSPPAENVLERRRTTCPQYSLHNPMSLGNK